MRYLKGYLPASKYNKNKPGKQRWVFEKLDEHSKSYFVPPVLTTSTLCGSFRNSAHSFNFHFTYSSSNSRAQRQLGVCWSAPYTRGIQGKLATIVKTAYDGAKCQVLLPILFLHVVEGWTPACSYFLVESSTLAKWLWIWKRRQV